MPLCIVNSEHTPHPEGQLPIGHTEVHFGYVCQIIDGALIADVPDDLVQTELEAGRVTLLPPAMPPAAPPEPEGKKGVFAAFRELLG